MGYHNNREPRRFWKTDRNRVRVPCASCGAPARPYGADLPFCDTCLDWMHPSSLAERSDLGATD